MTEGKIHNVWQNSYLRLFDNFSLHLEIFLSNRKKLIFYKNFLCFFMKLSFKWISFFCVSHRNFWHFYGIRLNFIKRIFKFYYRKHPQFEYTMEKKKCQNNFFSTPIYWRKTKNKNMQIFFPSKSARFQNNVKFTRHRVVF